MSIAESKTERNENTDNARTLTARQDEVLDYIHGFIIENWVPPTWRELMSALGYRSTNGVNDVLNALEKKGALCFVRCPGGEGRARGRHIRLTNDPRITGGCK